MNAVSRQTVHAVEGKSLQLYSLDALRGIAALMVALFHIKKYIWKTDTSFWWQSVLQEGYLGVYMFFVISGFIIPYSLSGKDYTIAKFFRFMGKRLLRLHPPYVLFILLLLFWNYGLYTFKGWGNPVFYDVRQFLLNVSWTAPFFGAKWIVIIFWTLAVEFQYYMLTGLTHPLLMRYRAAPYLMTTACIGLGYLIPSQFLTIFHYYIFFAIGFQTFLFYTGRTGRVEFMIFMTAASAFILYSGLFMALLATLLTVAGIFLLKKDYAVPRFLGNISYSLYLSHGLAGGAVAIFTVGRWPEGVRFITAVTVAVIFAFIYWRLVERPFIRLSKKIRM